VPLRRTTADLQIARGVRGLHVIVLMTLFDCSLQGREI
jgi:hypothetical protein